MPDRDQEEAMRQLLAKVHLDMPDVKKTDIAPFGLFERMMLPSNAAAATSPFTGNIKYNPNMMKSMSSPEKANTLAHELTHARQTQSRPFLSRIINQMLPQSEYGQRSDEMEAFQTERDRSLRNKLSLPDPQSGAVDIQLPSMRRKNGTQRIY